MDWQGLSPAQKQEAVTTLCNQGLSNERIAERLGAPSRHAVASVLQKARANGHGPKPRMPGPPGAGKPDDRPKVTAPRRGRRHLFEPLPDCKPVHIVDLGRTQCRWPVNGFDGSEPIFCGRDCEPDEKYCPEHRRIAYRRNAKGEAEHGCGSPSCQPAGPVEAPGDYPVDLGGGS